MSDEKKKKKPRRIKGEGSIFFIENKKLWCCAITVGYDVEKGTQKRKRLYSKTKSALIEKKKEFERNNNLVDKSSITFEQNFYRYLYLIKKPELKEKSWERYEGLYKNYISKAPFVYKKLSDLTYTDIKIWYNESEISASSLEVINRLIKASLKTAIKDKIITDNVLDDVTMKYKPDEQKYNVLSLEEQKKLIEYLSNCTLKQEPLKYLFLFTLSTGLRLGEALALEKDDIKENAVKINKSVQRIKVDGHYKQVLTTPKTKSSIREVPLPQKTIDMIKSMPKSESKLLFPDEKSGGFIFTNRPLKRIIGLCNKLEITQITFHGLRHTYATRLFELGVQIKTVQKLMGHTDIQTTMNIYTHVMKNVIDDAVQNLNTIL